MPVVFVFLFQFHCHRVGAFRILDSGLIRTFVITLDPQKKLREQIKRCLGELVVWQMRLGQVLVIPAGLQGSS